MPPSSLVDQPATWVAWKGKCFVLSGIDTYSGYRITFPAYSASAKPTICGLTECFIHHHGIAYNIVSDKGTHFTEKEA